MTKFNVGDKVEFIEKYGPYGIGDKVTATSCKDGNLIDFKGKHGTGCALESRFKLSDKPSKNQRITKLESEIAELLPLKEEVKELKLIVHQLRTPSTTQSEIDVEQWSKGEVEGVIEYEGQQYQKVDRVAREGDVVVIRNQHLTNAFKIGRSYKVLEKKEIKSDHIDHRGGRYNVYSTTQGRTPETVDVYELIVEDNPFPPSIIPESVKSPNKLRAEIIEKAKGFVEESLNQGKEGSQISDLGNETHQYKFFDAEFEINKNEVKVSIYQNNSRDKRLKQAPLHVAYAKCHPNNVFNEHIGKAIALGRALGLDVSEFEQAVQPNEVVVGMKTYHEWSHEIWEISGGNLQFINNQHRIINDTNAIYGGVE